jgi:hypothetical protein
MGYKFTGLRQGDVIEMHAWQKGNGAQLVISGKGKNCGDFFFNYPEIRYRSGDGWNKLEQVITFNTKCYAGDSTQCVFFIWNPDSARTYIDDIKFVIKKYEGYYFPD